MVLEGSGEEDVMMKERGEKLITYERRRKRGTQRQEEEKKAKKITVSTSAEEPATRRSVRERKVVKPFSFPDSELVIKKGKGMQLKDIPNVAHKLSKIKADKKLRILHKILFSKKTNRHQMQSNICQFSGFVWTKNEDKERRKLKEKLDNCVKKYLFDFCELLDIPVSKESKKVELSAKLLKFLECPHPTAEVSLDEEKIQKYTRNDEVSEIENDKDESSDEDDEEQDGPLREEGGKSVSQAEKKEKEESVKKKGDDVSCSLASKPNSKGLSGKHTAPAQARTDPSQAEMLAVVSDMVRTADFDHASLNDILKELEAYFNTDLSHKKDDLMSMIKEAVNNMMDSEEDEDGDEDEKEEEF